MGQSGSQLTAAPLARSVAAMGRPSGSASRRSTRWAGSERNDYPETGPAGGTATRSNQATCFWPRADTTSRIWNLAQGADAWEQARASAYVDLALPSSADGHAVDREDLARMSPRLS